MSEYHTKQEDQPLGPGMWLTDKAVETFGKSLLRVYWWMAKRALLEGWKDSQTVAISGYREMTGPLRLGEEAIKKHIQALKKLGLVKRLPGRKLRWRVEVAGDFFPDVERAGGSLDRKRLRRAKKGERVLGSSGAPELD